MAKCSVTTLDRIFSKCVRERADWRCEYENCKFCENNDFRYYGGQLDCSHLYSRETRATRWHPDNAASICNARHRWFHKHPVEHAMFHRRLLGDARFDELVLRGNGHRKYTASDRAEMNAHYRAQLKYLERRRRDGEQGYIDIVSWD